MKKIVVVVCLPFLLATSWFLISTWKIRSDYWTPLSLPPQPIVKFIANGRGREYDSEKIVWGREYDSVTIQASDDIFYHCRIYQSDSIHQCLEWVEIEPFTPSDNKNFSTDCTNNILPILPRKRIATTGCDSYYVLMEDGSIWYHYIYDYPVTSYLLVILIYVGTIFAFLIGVVISGVIFVKSKKSQHEENEEIV